MMRRFVRSRSKSGTAERAAPLCLALAILCIAFSACSRSDGADRPAVTTAGSQSTAREPQPAAAPAQEANDEQRRHMADMQIKMLVAGLEAFKLDNTRYPTTAEGLEVLVRRPKSLKRWEGPYLKAGLSRDPWGNVFIYSGPRAENKGDYKIASYGADGRLGGEGSGADISNRPETDERFDVPSTSTPETAWLVTEQRDEMAGTVNVSISRDAEHELGDPTGSRATLTVRCMSNRTDVLINVPSDTNGTQGASDVRVKLDSAKPLQQRWSEAPTGQGLLAPNAIRFAQQLARSRSLLFEYVSAEREEQLAKFRVSGLAKQLPKVAKACGWRMALR